MQHKAADVRAEVLHRGPFEGAGQVEGVPLLQVHLAHVEVGTGLEGPVVVPVIDHERWRSGVGLNPCGVQGR